MNSTQSISLTLSIDEVQALLHFLGETPTKFGLYPMTMKIKEQAESQVQPEAKAEEVQGD